MTHLGTTPATGCDAAPSDLPRLGDRIIRLVDVVAGEADDGRDGPEMAVVRLSGTRERAAALDYAEAQPRMPAAALTAAQVKLQPGTPRSSRAAEAGRRGTSRLVRSGRDATVDLDEPASIGPGQELSLVLTGGSKAAHPLNKRPGTVRPGRPPRRQCRANPTSAPPARSRRRTRSSVAPRPRARPACA